MWERREGAINVFGSRFKIRRAMAPWLQPVA
jgi:hypothetical protein